MMARLQLLTVLCTVCSVCLGAGIPATTSYAALGDSYASGDGVGSSRLLPNFDALCGRFDKAYPMLLINNPRLSFDPYGFKNLACGGATSATVTLSQLQHIGDSDVVSIQVGGNEVDFFLVLNECILQWKTFSSCAIEVTQAKSMIQSTKFISAFDGMMAQARRAAKPGTALLILGYAKFFNDESSQCNQITFSKTDPQNLLNNQLRRTINELVAMLNDVIEASARAHGAYYVDIDRVFEGHRFCEEDVIEPMPDWPGTWFFREPAPQALDWRKFIAQSHKSIEQTSLSNPFKDFVGLTRTFHPTVEGHAAIAEEIVRVVRQL